MGAILKFKKFIVTRFIFNHYYQKLFNNCAKVAELSFSHLKIVIINAYFVMYLNMTPSHLYMYKKHFKF